MSTYLPDVANNPKPGAYRALIEATRTEGRDYPRIWDLFAFQHDITIHMGRFTQGILREPASISPGLRELIAAYTSSLNECRFCTKAHAAAAAELLGSEALVRGVLSDVESSSLGERDKALLRLAGKITQQLPAIGEDDIRAARMAGWDDEAIYFAITTCALFNFYNRWITATGVPAMSDEAHRLQGRSLAARGYTLD